MALSPVTISVSTSRRMCLGSVSIVEFKKCPCRPVDFRGLPPYHNPFLFPPMSYLLVYFYEALIVQPQKYIIISQDVQVGTSPFSVFRVLFLFITKILGSVIPGEGYRYKYIRDRRKAFSINRVKSMETPNHYYLSSPALALPGNNRAKRRQHD